MIVIEESQLPHENLIVLAIYLTVGLSVLAHGLTAAPLADRYARWYERHPRDKAPPMEGAPADATRARGPAQALTDQNVRQPCAALSSSLSSSLASASTCFSIILFARTSSFSSCSWTRDSAMTMSAA